MCNTQSKQRNHKRKTETMNSRKLQERCEWPEVTGEWEDSTVSIRNMSDKEITALIRSTNKANKASGSVVRMRSVAEHTGLNW